MFPETPTHTEELIDEIKRSAPKTSEIIKDYINSHDTSKMEEGERYYYKENDIKDRKIYRYDNDGKKFIDNEATNNRLAAAWHKLLVDQKVAYLVGDAPTIGSKSGKDITPVLDIIGEEFNDTLPELVIASSNKGREWLHVYIDENGDFDYIIIPAQEVIPIYDNTKRKNLEAVIRYYFLDDDTMKVEVWDKDKVAYYEEVNGELVMDNNYDENPQSHFFYFKGEKKSGYGWEAVPFVEFANNSKRVSDLLFYKDYIDSYDKVYSDVTNTIEDVQQFLYILKGYEGTDMDNAVTNLKRFKGVAVGSEGGVDILQGEVPMQSVKEYLDHTVKDIYAQGMGVNTDVDKFGNNPSGVSLKNLYSLLDMKANMLERKFVKSLKQFMWFVTEYMQMAGKGEFDPKDFTFTFNKAMLTNEVEQVDMAQKSKGVISDDTILANHPWVEDIELEKQRLKEQREQEDSINLDAIPGEGNE